MRVNNPVAFKKAKGRILVLSLVSAFLLLMGGCRETVVRSYSPVSDTEKDSFGMVGFGLFIYQPNEKNLLNVVLSSSGTLYTNLQPSYITIEEVISIDHAKKKLVTKPLDAPKVVSVDGEGSADFDETIFSSSENFFQLVSQEPGKKFVITEVAYTFKKSGGKGLIVTVMRRFPLDPYKSFQDFPIVPKPGKLEFAGVFMASILKTSDNDPYGVEDTNPTYKEIFNKSQVTPKLSRADKFIQIQRSDSLRDKYYGNLRPSPETMEMHFLNEIIQLYDGSYWKEVAESQLLQLNKID